MSKGDRIGESIDPEWLERRDVLRALDDWRLEGRLALSTGQQGYNGTLTWEQLEDDLDFRFRGPFGFGGFRIHGSHEQLRIKTMGGTELLMSDPETDMRDKFGWAVPVYSMRFWMVGVSDPEAEAEEIVDDLGRLVELEQNGWLVKYTAYRAHEGVDMPRKMTMENGELRIRVVADRWRVTGDLGPLTDI